MKPSFPGPRAVLAGIAPASVLRVERGGSVQRGDEVAVEEPLEVRIAGDLYAVTMRTPGHDAELVAGLLLSEGLIGSRNDLGTIAHCGRTGEAGRENVIDVSPAPGVSMNVGEEEGALVRRTVISSACGICGRSSVEDLFSRLGPSQDETQFDAEWLSALPDALVARQPSFARTGALHAAGAARSGAELAIVREDVGRHNAVDKVVGRLLLDDELPARGAALVVSGRASFEIVQKAVTAGFAAVVSVSGPSSLAVDTAQRFQLLLLGFTRNGAFNVYAGVHRLTPALA